MSYTLPFIYTNIREFGYYIVVYQNHLEKWLKNNNQQIEQLQFIDDDDNNDNSDDISSVIQLIYDIKEVYISIMIKTCSIKNSIDFIVDYRINDELLLNNFQTLMNEIQTKMILEHSEREDCLMSEEQMLCNIEYAMDKC